MDVTKLQKIFMSSLVDTNSKPPQILRNPSYQRGESWIKIAPNALYCRLILNNIFKLAPPLTGGSLVIHFYGPAINKRIYCSLPEPEDGCWMNDTRSGLPTTVLPVTATVSPVEFEFELRRPPERMLWSLPLWSMTCKQKKM